MSGFTALEIAALKSIFSETPEWASDLNRQLELANVVKRENSGVGFFTTIAVSDEAAAVDCEHVLGYETGAHVDGLEAGFGFVLFMEDGRLHLLDAHAWGDDTLPLDLERLTFEVYRVPEGQTVPKSPF